MAKSPEQPRSARWRKWSRRATLAGIGFLILAIVVFVLLPVWISNDQGRAYVLDRLNARLNGPRVTVDKWTLGWFRHSTLINVRILQPDGTEILSCPHVYSGLTLWDLCWGNYDLRNTTADQLEMRVTKYADGTTSLESLTRGAGDVLQSARGAIQVNDGRLTFASVKANQVVRYTDVRATIEVASSEAPFHVKILAVEDVAAGTPPSPALGKGVGTISLTGTFPPTGTLSPETLHNPGIWSLLADFDFLAARLPSGIACDFAGVDGAWKESFGETLETVQISGHATAAQDGCRLSLFLKGALDGPNVDAVVMLRSPATARARSAAVGGSLEVSGKESHIDAALRWSPPLAALLGRLSPVLGEATPAATGAPAASPKNLVRGTVTSLNVPLDRTEGAEARFRISLPPLFFVPHDGPSIVRQMQVITGELPAPRTGAGGVAGAAIRVEGSAGLLQVRLADRRFSYENFLVTLGKSKLNFSGEVGVDGTLNLTALIPDNSAGTLSAGSTRVAVGGNVDSPVVKRAQ